MLKFVAGWAGDPNGLSRIEAPHATERLLTPSRVPCRLPLPPCKLPQLPFTFPLLPCRPHPPHRRRRDRDFWHRYRDFDGVATIVGLENAVAATDVAHARAEIHDLHVDDAMQEPAARNYFAIAALTLTATCALVQQHWKPPPPSPDESLAWTRRR